MDQQNAQNVPATRPGSTDIQTMEIDGAIFPFIDQGQGEPVVFLHGALTDLRMWKRHLDLVSTCFRSIAYTQRYFETHPWGNNWPPFGIATHAVDLIQFLMELAVGPVHLVAWSYAGHAALHAALAQPELFKSLFIYEPGFPTYVVDPIELDTLSADANAMYGPIFEAVQKGGNNEQGVRLLIDASGQQEGYFANQSRDRQEIELDNARTMPLLLAQAPPPLITCQQLSTLALPVCIAQGEFSRPVFSLVSRAAARCIPNCRHMVIPGASHMWPDEDPKGFSDILMDFLKRLQDSNGDFSS